MNGDRNTRSDACASAGGDSSLLRHGGGVDIPVCPHSMQGHSCPFLISSGPLGGSEYTPALADPRQTGMSAPPGGSPQSSATPHLPAAAPGAWKDFRFDSEGRIRLNPPDGFHPIRGLRVPFRIPLLRFRPILCLRCFRYSRPAGQIGLRRRRRPRPSRRPG